MRPVLSGVGLFDGEIGVGFRGGRDHRLVGRSVLLEVQGP